MRKFVVFIFAFCSVFSSFSQPELETILQKGHSKYITAADFHPNGRFAVTAGYDNAIILWNIETGKEVRLFNRHTGPVWSVEFSEDGTQILSTSADETIKLYDVLSGDLIFSWESGEHDIRQACFSTDEKFVICFDNRDGTHVYSRSSGEKIGTYNKNYSAFYQKRVIDPSGTKILSTSSYRGAEVFKLGSNDTILHIPFDKVYGMEFSPDGKKIALSSSKQFAKVFDAESGKELFELADPDSEEKCDGCNTKQVWSNSGKYIVTMSNKIDAILWDANSGKKIRALHSIRERPAVIKFSSDDSHVLFNIDETILVYNVKTGKKTMELKTDHLSYFDPNISKDGDYVILPGENNTAEIFNIKNGKRKTRLSGYLNKDRDDGLRFNYTNWTETGILKYITMRRSFALSPDGKTMAIGGIDSTALLIDIESGKVIKEFIGHSKIVLALDFSFDGKILATGSGDRLIKLWDVSTGEEIKTLAGHQNLVFDLAFNSEGNELVSAAWDGTIRLWDIKTGKYKYKETGSSSVYKVDYAPNDLYLIAGDLEKNLDFYESDALDIYKSLVGNTSVVGDFDFSPSGREIVSSCWDGKVKVWDIYSGMQIGRLKEHTGPTYAVAWDPQGRFIASAGADNHIILWEYKTNKVMATLEGHNDAITDLKFTPKGNKLISMSAEGQVIVWDMVSKKADYSRTQISRNEWLSTTTSGHFDGTKKALNLINYVSGMEVVPVGSLFDKYFTPGLIPRVNAGEDFNDTGENINQLIQKSPLIAFHLTESSKRSIPVEEDSIYTWKRNLLPLAIQINTQEEELEEIRIYNNGKLIIAESFEEKLVFRGGEKDVRNYDIPLSDGENRISGIVVNKNRTESSPTEIVVNFDGEAAQTDLYIFSIGINDYKNPKYNLDYAVNDAKSFSKALVNGGDTLFNEIHEFSITNDKATKIEIEKTLAIIKSQIGPEDVFVLYYAGHGVMSFEKNADDSDFFIVTYDIVNLYGDVAILKEKAISAKELMQYSIQISAEKQLFVLDACHSGGALESFATRGDGREKALAQLARSTGTFFLTASQDAQYANEVGNLKHGLFTYALLEVIEGSVGDKGDKKVTINEVKSYVEDRVPELSEQYRGSPQYPTSYSFGQDFPLVILK